MKPRVHAHTWDFRDSDLGKTLDSGQAFRWELRDGGWHGVVGPRWVVLRQTGSELRAETVEDPGDWQWLVHYLGLDEDLDAVLATYPRDLPMTQAVGACRGLRLLRQDPWECLASFILSSTKQITQIRQTVRMLCQRYGTPVRVAEGEPATHTFPTASALAAVSEGELRECRMGFRARYLRETACRVAQGQVDLQRLHALPLEDARLALTTLPGVGRKIADCVLLFSCQQRRAFPLDVWILRTLRELYFQGREVSRAELEAFSETYFGPQAGYAQQYLFHDARMRAGRVASGGARVAG
ncbi:MAG: hypothetical protein IT580_14340 [Verrucomicrobiales bacterium]|jgi:N-glycosylase/DNA lyase|nr:hypothetical protein [Verrucomicrobiales bacterium]